MSIFPTKILLATDGSEEAASAARTAADLAQKTGSELHVVLVELSMAHVGMGPPEIADIPAPKQEELDEESQRLLDAQGWGRRRENLWNPDYRSYCSLPWQG